MDDLANDVHSLSHRLHSTRLHHLGLRSAIEELTKQISKQHQISINVSTFGRDDLLPPDVSLCLFRVTQEALNNAVRHGHARVIYIELNVERSEASLQISDSGIGFNISGCEGGIGLVSMRERLRMLGGEFSVQSREGQGTLITARVRFVESIGNKAA
jgi:signal transduction histidine kinase